MEINIETLKESREFLTLLLDHIETAVFIADEQLTIYQFNDSFLSLFSRRRSNLVNITFGPAAGCINSIQENKACGQTSACANCILKRSLLDTLMDKNPKGKKSLERIFFINGIPQKKYLEFTSRQITFHGKKMILVFVYDITEIEQSKIQLKKKQKQIDLDLKKAGEIQISLLPKHFPDMPEVTVAWAFEPCLSIGGDIFHFYRENPDWISLYMLDVCGHGVAASLIAVTVKQHLDRLFVQGITRNQAYPPAEILNALEAEFPFERFDCYFTIAYIRLNVKTGEIIYGCAGHVPPLILKPTGEVEELDQHGPIIGLGQDLPLEQYRGQLHPGEKLILYTDGLIDYFGKRGALENKGNLYSTLSRVGNQSSKTVVAQVMARFKEFRKSCTPDDDVSVLAVEYLGNP